MSTLLLILLIVMFGVAQCLHIAIVVCDAMIETVTPAFEVAVLACTIFNVCVGFALFVYLVSLT